MDPRKWRLLFWGGGLSGLSEYWLQYNLAQNVGVSHTPITYTNTTALNVIDGFGQLVQVAANSPAFDGMRAVTNLSGATPDSSNGTNTTGVADCFGGNTAVTFTSSAPGGFSRVVLNTLTNGLSGTFRTSLYIRRRTGTGTVQIISPSLGAQKTITVTSSWQRFASDLSPAYTNTTTQLRVTLGTSGDAVDICGWQAEDITGQTNQNPSEYVPTTSAAVTQWYPYANPMTVDANGVVTDSGVRTMLAPGNGSVHWPPGTNLYTGYSTPGADQFLAELSSGSTVVGNVYQITAYSAVNRTLAGAANNTVGTEYVCTLAQTNTAADKVKEKGGTRSDTGAAVSGLGTGATATSAANPIPGITVSGDAAGKLTIVADTAAITAAGLLGFCPSGKVYKIDGSAAAALFIVDFSGVINSLVAGTYSIYARASSGTGHLKSNYATNNTSINSSAYSRVTHIPVPANLNAILRVYVDAGSTVYVLIPQVETSASATSPIITNGATNTRGYTSYTVPETMGASGYRPRSFEFTPRYLSTTPVCIEDNYTDALNWNRLWANTMGIMFEKQVAGVSTYACCYTTLAAGSTYLLKRWFNPDNTVGVSVDGVAGLSGLGPELYPSLNLTSGWTAATATILGAASFQRTGGSGWVYKVASDAYKAYQTTTTASVDVGTYSICESANVTALRTGDGSVSYVPVNTTAFVLRVNTLNSILSALTLSHKLVYNNTDTTAPVIAGTTRIGSAYGGVSVVDGWIKNVRTN